MDSSRHLTLLGAVAIALAACVLPHFYSLRPLRASVSQLHPLLHPLPSCSVKGGAFEGYYHSYGYLAGLDERRLSRDPDPSAGNLSTKAPYHRRDPSTLATRSYSCYSGGCFAALTHILEIPLEQVLDVGVDIQSRWMSGELSRFDVVKLFLEVSERAKPSPNSVVSLTPPLNLHPTPSIQKILPSSSNSTIITTSPHSNVTFQPLNVITTDTTGKPITSTPTDVAEVHDLLIKTSWIPFITGNSLYYDGQIDGFLSSHSHPSFAEEVPGLPWNLEGFKLSLTRADAEAAYNNGFALALNTTLNHAYC